MQPVQDLTVEDRISRTQYQYSLDAPDKAMLDQWIPRLVDKLKQIPELRDVATDQQNNGLGLEVVIDRDTAGRLGITPQNIDDALYDAFGQRQVSTIYTQSNQYPRDSGSRPAVAAERGCAEGSVRADRFGVGEPGVDRRAGGHQYRAHRRGADLAGAAGFVHQLQNGSDSHHDQSSGAVPGGDAFVQSGAGRIAGRRGGPISARRRRSLGMPASIEPTFQGTARAFENSLANEPILILAAIVTVYIVLGVLYESYIHPITILSTLPSAGVGAIAALILFHEDLDVIALIGIILLIGIVKKNAIMMIDFALEAERKEGKTPEEAIYQACLLRFRPIMMTTMAALLGAVPLAFGTGVGSELRKPLGITHHRRAAGQPGADAVHHAGHLSLVRPHCGLGGPSARNQPANRRRSDRLPRAAWSRRLLEHEHFHAIYRAARRDHSADDRADAGGRNCLYSAARLARCRRSISRPSTCSASLPGASPEVMAASVATPLEKQFTRIAGVTEMTSSSSVGSAPGHSAVRSEPRYQRGRARCAGGHQRRRRISAVQPAAPTRLTERSIRPIRRS